jgi:hypothetical protein
MAVSKGETEALPADFHDTLYWGFIGGTPLVVVWLIGTLIALEPTQPLIDGAGGLPTRR